MAFPEDQQPIQAPTSSLFVPDPSLLPQQGDSFQALTQLLQQLQGQPYQPPQQSKLTQVLNALAQGAAIAASPNPGETLGGILNTRLQIQQSRENAERARQGQLQTAMIQAALEKARGSQQEQTQARQARLGQALQVQTKKQELSLETQAVRERDLDKLDVVRKEAIQNNDLANMFSRDTANRTQLIAMAQKYPEILSASNQQSALIQTLVPDMPLEIAESLGKKLNGALPPNFTPQEKQYYSQFVQKRSEIESTERAAKLALSSSQTQENLSHAQFYSNQLAALQQAYDKNVLSNSIREEYKAADTQYYDVPDGKGGFVRMGESKIRGTIGAALARPLSPEENAKEIIKQQQKIKDLTQELQNRNLTAPQPGAPTAQDPYLEKLKQFIQQGNSREAAIQQVLNSTTLTQELKTQYVNLIKNNFEELKGQFVPAAPTNKPNKLPPGVHKEFFLRMDKSGKIVNQ